MKKRNKAKKLLSALLAVSLMFSTLAVSASAAAPPDDDDCGIAPLTSTPPTPVTLNCGSQSKTFKLNVCNGMNWFRIAINTKVSDITFEIQKMRTRELTYVMDGTVTPNGITQGFHGYLPDGLYEVQVRVRSGNYNLGGMLWYELAETEAAVNY